MAWMAWRGAGGSGGGGQGLNSALAWRGAPVRRRARAVVESRRIVLYDVIASTFDIGRRRRRDERMQGRGTCKMIYYISVYQNDVWKSQMSMR